MWWFIIGLVFLLAVGFLAASGEDKKQKNEQDSRSKLNDLRAGKNNGFKPNWVIEGMRRNDMVNPLYAVAGSDAAKKGCYFDGRFSRFFNYSDVLKAELVVDDSVKVSKKSPAIGKAIVGGVVAGVPGAVVGSLLGKTETSAVVSSISVRIVLKDSTVEVRCLKEKSSDAATQEAMQTARRIMDKMTQIMG